MRSIPLPDNNETHQPTGSHNDVASNMLIYNIFNAHQHQRKTFGATAVIYENSLLPEIFVVFRADRKFRQRAGRRHMSLLCSRHF